MPYVQVIEKENYAILQLDRGKSNPINHDVVNDLRDALKQVLDNEGLQGAIIHGKPNFFSVGLDLPELYQYNEHEFAAFWEDFMSLVCELVSFDKPLIAAINGHAPAGGCILAIGCDYRVMVEGNFKIGLNEIPIGIAVPRGVFDIYAFWLGRKTAYQYLMEGKMYLPEHAKEIGLVDEITTAEKVLETAENKLKFYLQFNQPGWRVTKRQLRQDQLKSMKNMTSEDLRQLYQVWWSPEVRAMLLKFVENLKKK